MKTAGRKLAMTPWLKVNPLFLWAMLCLPALAQTNWGTVSFTTPAGVTVEDARVIKVDSEKLLYVATNAVGAVRLADLPPALQARFGFAAPPVKTSEGAALTPDDPKAMIALGDEFYQKWQDESAADAVANRDGLMRPKPATLTGLSSGTSTNYQQSLAWYAKAAAMGDATAMWRIVTNSWALPDADQLDPATGLPVSKEARFWLKKLAGKGDAEALHRLSALDSALAPAPLEPVARPDLEILDVRAKVTEMGLIYWRWSYQVNARNNASQPVDKSVEVLFLDADGFVVDRSDCKVELAAGQANTFLGTQMITLPGAKNVKSVKVQ